MLKEKIDQDIKDALRAKNQVASGTLRMLKARIQNEAIAKQKEFSDGEIADIVASEIKKRRDSVAAYTSGNRPELAAQEQAEIAVLMGYMPEQLSEEEVGAAIDREIAGKGFTSADFGKAMGAVMPSLKGKASGDVISKILKQKLS